jgi:spore maturation protein CgeB
LMFFREPEEIVCYGTFDELVEKIDRYLPDERERSAVAARAREVVRKCHSWDVRILEMLERHEALGT